MSSFKRKVKVSNVDSSSDASGGGGGSDAGSSSADVYEKVSGCKSWVNNGLGIVSSGSRQLDELLGGGMPLGTATLHLADMYSTYAASLLAYTCAESLSHQHNTAVLTLTAESNRRFRALLPYNRNLDPEPEAAAPQASGLTIAWQYEKYLNKAAKPLTEQTLGLPFCCSYDLSKHLQLSLEDELANIIMPTVDATVSERLAELLRLLSLYLTSMRQRSPRAVARVFLPDFHEFFFMCNDSAIHEVARFMLRLKRMLWGSRCMVSISLNPRAMPPAVLQALEQSIDTVLSVESFSGRMHCVPYEFDRFSAFLVIHKIQQYGMLAPYKPSSSRYGIIRDRRKLNIEPLHLPPEESRSFGTAGADPAASIAQAIGGGCSSSASAAGTGSKQAKPEQPSSRHVIEFDHDHGHAHDHDHSGACSGTAAGAATGKPASSGVSISTSVGTGKMSLAGSLAAARAARQAGSVSAGNSASKAAPLSGGIGF